MTFKSVREEKSKAFIIALQRNVFYSELTFQVERSSIKSFRHSRRAGVCYQIALPTTHHCIQWPDHFQTSNLRVTDHAKMMTGATEFVVVFLVLVLRGTFSEISACQKSGN